MVEIEKMPEEDPLKSVIKGLTLGRIEGKAIECLEVLLKEGFTAARENSFPVHSSFKEKYREVIEREGLIDAWLSFICFCSFAQGISVGRNAEKIEKKDLIEARNKICERYPYCTVMRLEKFSAVLNNIIWWYDEQK